MPSEPSELEKEFAALWETLYPNIDLWAEHRIIPGRRYRFDFVHLESKVAVEIQGQIWRKGRHNTGKGLMDSYEKINLAAMLGWRVFQLSGEMITADWLGRIAKTIRGG
jgi:very-short-patch-repair endonuclease